MSLQLSQKNLKAATPLQQASSLKLIKNVEAAVSVDRADSSMLGGGGDSRRDQEVFLDSRGQPLPRDLNGALLAFNAFLDQNKIYTQSPKGTSEKSVRMNTGFPERTLSYQSNLLKVIDESFLQNIDRQGPDAQMQHSMNPLLKAHLRNLIHLTFKRKLFALHLYIPDS